MTDKKSGKNAGGKEKPETQWYIADMDANTNEWVAKQLARTAEVQECESLIDDQGSEHKGYAVAWKMVDLVRKSKRQFGFDFKIYRRQGKNGKLSEALFLDKTKKKFKIRQGDKTVRI